MKRTGLVLGVMAGVLWASPIAMAAGQDAPSVPAFVSFSSLNVHEGGLEISYDGANVMHAYAASPTDYFSQPISDFAVGSPEDRCVAAQERELTKSLRDPQVRRDLRTLGIQRIDVQLAKYMVSPPAGFSTGFGEWDWASKKTYSISAYETAEGKCAPFSGLAKDLRNEVKSFNKERREEAESVALMQKRAVENALNSSLDQAGARGPASVSDVDIDQRKPLNEADTANPCEVVDGHGRSLCPGNGTSGLSPR